MKQKAYRAAFPAALSVVIVAFLSTIFFAGTNPSFAATGKKKSAAIARTTAVDYTEARIKQLQEGLNINNDQKELWNNLVQVMRENAKDMDALTRERTGKNMTMNAVEHLKFHIQISEAHLAQLKKFILPFEALYNSLTDEQKQIADTIMETGRHEKHKKHNR